MTEKNNEIILLTIKYFENAANTELNIVEEEIIATLIEYGDDPHLTMKKIAHKVNTSITSISRLANKLQFSGYPILKLTVNQIYYQIDQSIIKSIQYESINFRKELKERTEFVYQGLDQSLDKIDFTTIQNFINYINKANHIMILATGFSAILGQYLASHLQYLGKYVMLSEMIISTDNLDNTLNLYDLFITISKSAENISLEKHLQIISKLNKPNILLTGYTMGFLNHYADLIITIPDFTNHLNPLNNSFFQLKMIFLLDFILTKIEQKK